MRSPGSTVRPVAHLAALLAGCAMLCAGSVRAQPEVPDAAAAARRVASEGAEHYNLGHFEEALAAYSEAYELYSAPQLLFNIGQCHRELGHHERVVFFFERFLEELPQAPNRAVVEELLVEARAHATRERAEAAEAERAERERLVEARAAAAREAERERLARATQTPDAAPAEPPVWEQWWLWTIVGVVVVGVALGVGLGIGLSPEPQLPMGSLGVVDGR